MVRVRPELVVEIAFDGVQTSPRYPGGLALRFARVLRYRPDKQAAEADTIDAVRAIWAGSAPEGVLRQRSAAQRELRGVAHPAPSFGWRNDAGGSSRTVPGAAMPRTSDR